MYAGDNNIERNAAELFNVIKNHRTLTTFKYRNDISYDCIVQNHINFHSAEVLAEVIESNDTLAEMYLCNAISVNEQMTIVLVKVN